MFFYFIKSHVIFTDLLFYPGEFSPFYEGGSSKCHEFAKFLFSALLMCCDLLFPSKQEFLSRARVRECTRNFCSHRIVFSLWILQPVLFFVCYICPRIQILWLEVYLKYTTFNNDHLPYILTRIIKQLHINGAYMTVTYRGKVFYSGYWTHFLIMPKNINWNLLTFDTGVDFFWKSRQKSIWIITKFVNMSVLTCWRGF